MNQRSSNIHHYNWLLLNFYADLLLPMYLQYGSGFCAPQEWTNYDSSPTLRLERLPIIGRLITKNERRFPGNIRFGDIVKGLPIRPNSCQAIYCSHVLEHLAYEDLLIALDNTFQYLKAGGTFRAVLPDLRYLANEYLQSQHVDAAYNFMQASGLGQKTRAREMKSFLKEWFGNSRHRWLWDKKSLSAVLERVGFTEIRGANYGDSSNDMFKLVEDPARFGGSFAIECTKPCR